MSGANQSAITKEIGKQRVSQYLTAKGFQVQPHPYNSQQVYLTAERLDERRLIRLFPRTFDKNSKVGNRKESKGVEVSKLQMDDLESLSKRLSMTPWFAHVFHVPNEKITYLVMMPSVSVPSVLDVMKSGIDYRKDIRDRNLINNDAVDYYCWEEEPFELPEEVGTTATYLEGAVKQIMINAYERDAKARQACITHYGATCQACGFDFAKTYGELGAGYIHVHHLKQLADTKGEYEVNPITDLNPVCPNCHAMIHRHNPPYSIQEVRNMLEQAKRNIAI